MMHPSAVVAVMILMAAASPLLAQSIAPAPMASPPPLATAEMVADQPDRPMSGILVAAGDVTLAAAPVSPGGQLISIPFRYRHTAVISHDVRGFSFTVGGVQAPAGSPGYLVGRFSEQSNGMNSGSETGYDMWCFLPSLAGGKRQHLCLLRDGSKLAAIAPTRANPFLWYSFAPMTGSFDYVRAPMFEIREIEIPLKLALAYQFDGWTGRGEAKITELAGDRRVRSFLLSGDATGRVTIKTFAGKLHLTRPAPDSPAATAAWEP